MAWAAGKADALFAQGGGIASCVERVNALRAGRTAARGHRQHGNRAAAGFSWRHHALPPVVSVRVAFPRLVARTRGLAPSRTSAPAFSAPALAALSSVS